MIPRLSRRGGFVTALTLVSVALLAYLSAPKGYGFDASSWEMPWQQTQSGLEDITLSIWREQPATQKSCDRCSTAGDFCNQVGSRSLDLAAAYEGSGDRIRRVLAKAARGEPIVFGILGGSVSRGHGCNNCVPFHRQIFDWINTTYPHAGHRYTDGSVGARGTNYFKFCHVEHLPSDADLVVLEHAVNDNAAEDSARNMESIVRAVLQYKNAPAVLLVESFHLLVNVTQGGDSHLPVAEYYDVPVINLRSALLPIMMRRPKAVDEFFSIGAGPRRDQVHPNARGHAILAQFATSYLARQKCLIENPHRVVRPTEPMFIDGLGDETDETGLGMLDVPRLTLMSPWSPHGTVPDEHPTCASIDSERNPITPLNTTHGWELWSQPGTEKQFWRATQPGARFEHKVNLATGHIMLYYLRSKKMDLGRVKCWLNDDEAGAVTIDSWWHVATSIGVFTSLRDPSKGTLEPGEYTLKCDTLAKHPGKEEGRGTTFLIIAVLTV
ncbi:hypothetical protein BKA62DRAFT_774527 [Auriculariales sp. MPI-PUGE-AT-0066]|nr:hypothetical protein BKA62DRAFT_774527 [Auriculariales sp. MPI-PUGE-AT-0066]